MFVDIFKSSNSTPSFWCFPPSPLLLRSPVGYNCIIHSSKEHIRVKNTVVMAAYHTEIEILPPLLRDMSTGSLTTSSCWVSDNSWASDGATPTTSLSSSRGESPEPKLDADSSQSDSDAVESSIPTPSVKNICFVGAGFVGENDPFPFLSHALSVVTIDIFEQHTHLS